MITRNTTSSCLFDALSAGYQWCYLGRYTTQYSDQRRDVHLISDNEDSSGGHVLVTKQKPH